MPFEFEQQEVKPHVPVASYHVEQLSLINLSDWNSRFKRLIEETAYRPKLPSKKQAAKDESQSDSPAEISASIKRITFEALQIEWDAFITELEKEERTMLVSHLRMCEIEAFSDGLVKLKCVRQFSFDELSGMLDTVSDLASRFYETSLTFDLRHDREGAKATRERTPFELFHELARKNKLVKFLIDEFGAEPIY